MSRFHSIFLETKDLTLEELQSFGEGLAIQQRGVNWWIGDTARFAKYGLKLGDNYTQVFPEWMSPGLIQRCEAVALAYPREEDRNPSASWTTHMQHANKPDRIALVAATVEKGLTSDESRKADQQEGADRPRWCLAVDVHYFLHRFWFSGAGVEAAVGVATWIQRTVERLRDKGLTDVACCFDSTVNHRKELTAGWEDRYKDRPPKDPELVQQLNLARELLEGHGFACISVDGYEADDCMASMAKQFPGRVTLLTQDKDCRQCLSDKCNMLLDVQWTEDETSGDMLPDYKWLSAKQHTETTGISPGRWVEYQAIMGDATDGIKGVAGIGEKGAADLVKDFGTVEACIEAAKAEDERIKAKKREALVEFEAKLEVTRQLVTLRTDLALSQNTRI
jgi:5'-3' exonuclease